MNHRNSWRNSCIPAENAIEGEFADQAGIPGAFSLTVYPNPFNARTAISFELPEPAEVELTVFDITGRAVESLVNGHLSFGMHEYVWDAEGMTSGVYFARLTGIGRSQ